jgi:hypothetical protein
MIVQSHLYESLICFSSAITKRMFSYDCSLYLNYKNKELWNIKLEYIYFRLHKFQLQIRTLKIFTYFHL